MCDAALRTLFYYVIVKNNNAEKSLKNILNYRLTHVKSKPGKMWLNQQTWPRLGGKTDCKLTTWSIVNKVFVYFLYFESLT